MTSWRNAPRFSKASNAFRTSDGAAERVLDAISAHGTQESSVPEMLTRARLYDLVDYEAYNQFDTGIFNFQVPGLDITGNNSNL